MQRHTGRGLVDDGENLYRPGSNSGDAVITTPGGFGTGQVGAGVSATFSESMPWLLCNVRGVSPVSPARRKRASAGDTAHDDDDQDEIGDVERSPDEEAATAQDAAPSHRNEDERGRQERDPG